jgi:transposase InsO family protein
MAAVEDLAGVVGTAPACAALTVSRASLYRRRRPRPAPPRPRRAPARALSVAERQAVCDLLHAPRFADRAPAQVYATLLDEDVYHCSSRTMYRILASRREVRERRDQLRHPRYQRPELLATAPNQVWSWDITKLLGPIKWSYYYLYVILDIFSRYVVGWMLALQEATRLAKRLIAETCAKQTILPGQLTIHADRGASMRSQGVAMLLGSLGITKTHSRPHVSNDNPYSEAQFKTVKYCPEFPDRFGSYEDALGFGHRFFHYYNHEHRHSGIGLMTPAAVHHGRAPQIIVARQDTLLTAYTRHPERFVHRPPQPPRLPEAVWINPPVAKTALLETSGSTISTPDDVWIPPDLAFTTPVAINPDRVEAAH